MQRFCSLIALPISSLLLAVCSYTVSAQSPYESLRVPVGSIFEIMGSSDQEGASFNWSLTHN